MLGRGANVTHGELGTDDDDWAPPPLLLVLVRELAEVTLLRSDESSTEEPGDGVDGEGDGGRMRMPVPDGVGHV